MALLQDPKPRLVGAAAVEVGPRSAGEVLRRQREALGLDFNQAAAALKIKPAYLAALEEGRPDGLPAAVYARGFMRAYAEYLGLDGDEVLRRGADGSTALAVKPDLSFPIPLAERSLPGNGMLAAAVILALCGYGAYFYLSSGERSRPQRVTEVPAALLPTKIEAAVPHPAEAQAAPQPAPTSAKPPDAAGSFDPVSGPPPAVVNASVVDPSTAAVPSAPPPQTAALPVAPSAGDSSGAAVGASQIIIRVTADSWVQLVQLRDGARSVLLARVLKAGESYRVPEGTGLSMRTGNAGGLEITVNGNPAPPLGPMGAVRRNVVLDPQALMAGTAVRD